VGGFVFLGLCALGWLVYKFGELPIAYTKLGSFSVYVQFPTASGVQTDTPVQFCGYQVGKVIKVVAPEMREDLVTGQEYHQTVVVFGIDKRYRDIPSNVDVKLMARGLGSSYIDLKVDPSRLPAPPRDPNRPETSFLVNGMWLQGSTGLTSEFFPEESQKKLEELVNGLGTLIANTNDIIGDEQNKDNFRQMLANMSEVTGRARVTLDKASEALEQAKQTLEKFREFSATGTESLKKADVQIEQFVASVVGTSEQLSKTLAQLRLILEKVNTGRGAAGRFVNDGKLYESMLENAEQMELLLKELKDFVSQSRRKGLPLKLK